MPPDKYPSVARTTEHWAVELQCLDGSSADWREPQQHRAIVVPAEMNAPRLDARIEQRCKLAGLRIGGVGLRALQLIARAAGAPQVLAHRWPTGGDRQQVFGAERDAGEQFVGLTVAAAVPSILQQLMAKGLRG